MTAAPGRAEIVRNGDVGLFCRRFGAPGGTPVLIVHGLSYFSWDWIEVADALARTGREVAAMDMRGFGDSSRSPGRAYGLDDHAGDFLALLDGFGWRRAVLMGHSMGGRNCAWCAAAHPGRVAALVLCDWSPVNAPEGSRRVAATVAGVPDRFASIDDALAYFGRDRGLAADHPERKRMEAYLRPAGDGFEIKRDPWHRERFRAILEGRAEAGGGPDMWTVFARIACPVLVVRGARSDMFAAENVPRMREANANAALVEIDAGHDVAGDAPEALLAEVETFLGGVP